MTGFPARPGAKAYLGDAVYVAFDGFALVLTTEDGRPQPTNRIVLEPNVYAALVDYVAALRTRTAAAVEDPTQ